MEKYRREAQGATGSCRSISMKKVLKHLRNITILSETGAHSVFGIGGSDPGR